MKSRTNRPKRRPWFQLLIVLILLPLAFGWLLYSFRSIEVACQRAPSGPINCSETEHISNFQIWSAQVADAKLERQPSDSEGNLGALYIETGDGTQVQFTSAWAGSSADTLESRLHLFLTDPQLGTQLNLQLGPTYSWRDWLPPVVFILILIGAALVLCFRVITG